MKETGKTAQGINFNSIAAMLCEQELTEEQKKDIEAFNTEYDAAHEEKIAGTAG